MTRVEPRWLSVDDVISINEDEVISTGEPFLVMDRGLLESAIDKPRNRWAYDEEGREDIVTLAVSLMIGIAQNHPFAQGNKRTAHTAALNFIIINGYEWAADDTEATAVALLAFIRGEVTETFLVDIFAGCIA